MFEEKDETMQAVDLLRSGNISLAENLKTLVHAVISKANKLVDEVETPNDLMTLMRTAEVAAKTMGLAPTESVTNVQINAISGFVYVLDDSEPTKQIDTVEVFNKAIPS